MPDVIVFRTQKEQDERDRNRWNFELRFWGNIFKFVIPIFIILFGWLFKVKTAVWIGIIWIVIALIPKIVKANRHASKKAFQSNSWEKIDKLPDWAYRKMKRKHSNVVNGEHYRYKKERNKFYRKLK